MSDTSPFQGIEPDSGVYLVTATIDKCRQGSDLFELGGFGGLPDDDPVPVVADSSDAVIVACLFDSARVEGLVFQIGLKRFAARFRTQRWRRS